MDRNRVRVRCAEGVTGPCAVARDQGHTCFACQRVVFGDGEVPGPNLKTGDQMPTNGEVRREISHNRALCAGGQVDHHVPRQHDDVETLTQRNCLEVREAPLEPGGLALGCRKHHRIQIDPYRIQPAAGEFTRDAPGTTTCVED